MNPEKYRKKKKKRLFIAGLVLFSLVLGSIGYLVQKFPALAPIDITNTILLTAIIEIIIILLYIILLVLGRNIVKLYVERRKRILGSKFKTKLITVFIGLALVPSILLFMFASIMLIWKIQPLISLETLLEVYLNKIYWRKDIGWRAVLLRSDWKKLIWM